jgi:hypothetical protein
MPGVFLCKKEDFVSFEYCDDFDLKTELFKPKDITHNVLQLGAVAVIEAQMFIFTQKFNRRTTVEFSTEPAILPNCCCAFVFLKIAFQKPFR